MDAYLRETGVEMETYARNGQRVRPREDEALVRALLLAYIARSTSASALGERAREGQAETEKL